MSIAEIPLDQLVWLAAAIIVAGVVTGYAMVHAPRERRALIQYGTCALVLAVVVIVTVLRTAQLT